MSASMQDTANLHFHFSYLSQNTLSQGPCSVTWYKKQEMFPMWKWVGWAEARGRRGPDPELI